MVMTVQEVYFQCARAIIRSDLWNADIQVDPKTLPDARTNTGLDDGWRRRW